jgi:hypothetical protein
MKRKKDDSDLKECSVIKNENEKEKKTELLEDIFLAMMNMPPRNKNQQD